MSRRIGDINLLGRGATRQAEHLRQAYCRAQERITNRERELKRVSDHIERLETEHRHITESLKRSSELKTIIAATERIEERVFPAYVNSARSYPVIAQVLGIESVADEKVFLEKSRIAALRHLSNLLYKSKTRNQDSTAITQIEFYQFYADGILKPYFAERAESKYQKVYADCLNDVVNDFCGSEHDEDKFSAQSVIEDSQTTVAKYRAFKGAHQDDRDIETHIQKEKELKLLNKELTQQRSLFLVRQVGRTERFIAKKIDSEHANKISFFIFNVIHLITNSPEVSRKTEKQAAFSKLAGLIKSRFGQSGKLDRAIEALQSKLTDQTPIFAHALVILDQYIREIAPADAKVVFECATSALADFDPTTTIKDDITSWQTFAGEKVDKISGFLSLFDDFLQAEAKHLANPRSRPSFYEVLFNQIQQFAKKQNDAAFSKMISKYLGSNTDILLILDNPYAILETINAMLVEYLAEGKQLPPQALQALEKFANYHYYGQAESPASPKIKAKAQHYLDLQAVMTRANLNEKQKEHIYHLLRILAQGKGNFALIIHEVEESAKKGIFDKRLFFHLLQNHSPLHPALKEGQLSKEQLGQLIDEIAVTAQISPTEKAVLLHVLSGQPQESLLRDNKDSVQNLQKARTIISGVRAANLAAVDDLFSFQSGIRDGVSRVFDSSNQDHLGGMIRHELKGAPEQAKEQLLKSHQAQQLRGISHQINEYQSEYTQKAQERDEAVAQLESVGTKFLNLLRSQVSIALLLYCRANPTASLMHTDSGFNNAIQLLTEIHAQGMTFETAITKLIAFLNRGNNLRDNSFTSFLLTQLFDRQGGLLSFPTKEAKTAADIEPFDLVRFSEKLTHDFVTKQNTFNAVLVDPTTAKDLSTKNRADLAVMGKTFVNQLGAAKLNSKEHVGETASKIAETSKLWHGLSGRWNIFNDRKKAETSAIAILSQLSAAMQG